MTRQEEILAQVLANHPYPYDPDNPAWSADVSTLVDLWLAKYGDAWVNASDLHDDTFYSIVATRLLTEKRLERHERLDNFYSVFRLVE